MADKKSEVPRKEKMLLSESASQMEAADWAVSHSCLAAGSAAAAPGDEASATCSDGCREVLSVAAAITAAAVPYALSAVVTASARLFAVRLLCECGGIAAAAVEGGDCSRISGGCKLEKQLGDVEGMQHMSSLFWCNK